MSEAERINKDISRIKREIQVQKNCMEKPGRNLMPNPKPKYLARLVQGRERLAAAKEALRKAGGEYKPDAGDIRASELLENLPFLKKLSFEIGGRFQGYNTYTIEALENDLSGRLVYQSDDYSFDPCRLLYRIDEECPALPGMMIQTADELADYLRSLHLEEWMPEYWPNRFGTVVLDGTQWDLEIEFRNGKPLWKSSGSNSYPYNFDDFQKLFGLSFDDEKE